MTTAGDSFKGHSLDFRHTEFSFLENAGDPGEVQIWEAEQDLQVDLTRNCVQDKGKHIFTSRLKL